MDVDNQEIGLGRFIEAQEEVYERVLDELGHGQKRSHWIWFIFPQMDGLGSSETAEFYSIKSLEEAHQYLNHPVLGSRLLECTELVYDIRGKSIDEVFGFPDNLKVKSSMTLFSLVAGKDNLFEKVIERHFHAKCDPETLSLLGKRPVRDDELSSSGHTKLDLMSRPIDPNMNIEKELLLFLEKHAKKGEERQRNIEIVAYFYGFRDAEWPTLEETAKRFGGVSRERIRQIINENFRDIAKASDFPILMNCVEVARKSRYWSVTELNEALIAEGLTEAGFSLRGLFNLMDNLDINYGLGIYTPELKIASRISIEFYDQNFVIDPIYLKKIRSLHAKARNLPGRCGIANLKYLDGDEEYEEYEELIIGLIKNSKNVWTKSDADGFWYVYENRDNTLINYSEKVFSVIDCCEAGMLAKTYRNALDSRTYTYAYPPTQLIEEYLRDSVFFENHDGNLSYLGETSGLNDIEKDVVNYLKSNGTVKYPQIRSHLESMGHGEANIIKKITSSPFVFVDKSEGRLHYTYSLVGREFSAVQKSDSFEKRYREYLLRLRNLTEIGTDETVEHTKRREQSVLREWLFKDKEQDYCAVCGNEYSVNTLVTAHKKKRSSCRDAERTDPYIVMPVCLVGCDYLYENQHIYILKGEIKRGQHLKNEAHEAVIIDKLIGRRIDAKWLKGPKSYFHAPE